MMNIMATGEDPGRMDAEIVLLQWQIRCTRNRFKKLLLFRNHLILIITLSGAPPPPLEHLPVARVQYYLFAIV